MLPHCQCEHSSHMVNRSAGITPNGNPAHQYGKQFPANQIVPVKTYMGVFEVCKACADDCYGPNSGVRA